MTDNRPLVDLGFAEAHLPLGTHICQIYSEDAERDNALLNFLMRGLQKGEQNACFSDNVTEESLKDFFAKHGVDFDDAKRSGAFSLSRTRDVYFPEGRFDPDIMLELLRSYHEDSVAAGYPAARVIGEMTAEINNVPGGSRLLEYESRVSILLKDHPVTAVCQYDARAFDGATVMDVLKVHPMMVVRGKIIHNPFFISPEEYLCNCGEAVP